MLKKILIIHDYPHMEGGGVEVQGFLDAQELVLRGFFVTIASTRYSSETYQGEYKPQKNGVDFAMIKNDTDLEKLIDDADIVHVRATFSLRTGTMNALRILTKKKRKYIISIHTNYKHILFGSLAEKPEAERQKLLSEFSSFLSSLYATTVGVSESLRDSLEEIGVSKPFTVIHNGKDWKNFLPSKNSTTLPMADVTYVGEISCIKGLHTLLGAIVLLKKNIPAVKIRFIGSGTSEQECLALIRSLGLKENIECIKHIENNKVPDYLVRTKILTLPSLTESWGNVVMEAMGLGTITVSSNIEGLIELTKNSTYGFLCDQGNSSDFAQTFLSVLNGTLSLPYTSDHIKKDIVETFSIKNRVDKLEKLYFKNL